MDAIFYKSYSHRSRLHTKFVLWRATKADATRLDQAYCADEAPVKIVQMTLSQGARFLSRTTDPDVPGQITMSQNGLG